VVVSPDTLNARNEGVVLVAVTSQIVRDAATVLLGQRDVMDGVLPKDSAARVAKLFTLHSSLVVKRLCRLKGEKRDELLRELRSFFQECAGLELLPAANLSLGQKFADVFRETVEEHRATARG
jgi:mRNA-degrading endonuclease toxin of MazEF toxin-antitoxin module